MSKSFDLPEWIQPLFKDSYRYIVLYGGRGSGKTYAVADALIIIAYSKNCIILCGREYQKSIKDSVHATLKERIIALGLEPYFEITRDEIRCKTNGSIFKFAGLRNNIESIKSIYGISYLWIEEGATLSRESWEVIKPTIREEGSQIIVTYNPRLETDCIHRDFVVKEPPKNAYVKKLTWRDNRFFTSVLNVERLTCLEADDLDVYNHVWEGETRKVSDAVIFKGKWVIDNFEVDNKAYKYIGLDFGYSVDPTAAVMCYIKDNTLYIAHEAGGLYIDPDKIGSVCEKTIPEFKRYPVIADSQRPDTIGYMRRQGYNVKPAEKGKGSIEDGIAYIRAFSKVVIHSRCKNTIEEFSTYSYEIDKHSGDITTKIVDSNNHYIDALRYALERCMRRKQVEYKNFKW